MPRQAPRQNPVSKSRIDALMPWRISTHPVYSMSRGPESLTRSHPASTLHSIARTEPGRLERALALTRPTLAHMDLTLDWSGKEAPAFGRSPELPTPEPPRSSQAQNLSKSASKSWSWAAR